MRKLEFLQTWAEVKAASGRLPFGTPRDIMKKRI